MNTRALTSLVFAVILGTLPSPPVVQPAAALQLPADRDTARARVTVSNYFGHRVAVILMRTGDHTGVRLGSVRGNETKSFSFPALFRAGSYQIRVTSVGRPFQDYVSQPLLVTRRSFVSLRLSRRLVSSTAQVRERSPGSSLEVR